MVGKVGIPRRVARGSWIILEISYPFYKFWLILFMWRYKKLAPFSCYHGVDSVLVCIKLANQNVNVVLAVSNGATKFWRSRFLYFGKQFVQYLFLLALFVVRLFSFYFLKGNLYYCICLQKTATVYSLCVCSAYFKIKLGKTFKKIVTESS